MTITKLPSGNYRVQLFDFTDENGKNHYKSITAPTKTEIKRLAAEFEVEKSKGKRKSGEIVTFDDALSEYINNNTSVFSPATIATYKSLQRCYFRRLAQIRVDKITSPDVQAEIEALARLGKSPKTIRNASALVTKVIAVYAPEKSIKVNLPEKRKSEIKIPTLDEMNRIFELAEGKPIELPIKLAALCGMREGEIAGLEWQDIDLEAGTAKIRHTIIRGEDGYQKKDRAKTYSGNRTVKLYSDILELLKERKCSCGNVTGMTLASIYHEFSRLLSRNGLPHYRFHDLRHYCVSMMLRLNIPKNYIVEYIGHSSAAMIDRVYGHVMPDASEQFAEQVEKFIDDKYHTKYHTEKREPQ